MFYLASELFFLNREFKMRGNPINLYSYDGISLTVLVKDDKIRFNPPKYILFLLNFKITEEACPAPKTPLNGGSYELNSDILTTGTIATFSCPSCMRLSGSKTAECKANRKWSQYNNECSEYVHYLIYLGSLIFDLIVSCLSW